MQVEEFICRSYKVLSGAYIGRFSAHMSISESLYYMSKVNVIIWSNFIGDFYSFS